MPPVVVLGVTASSATSEVDHKLIGTITDNLSVRDYSIGVGFGEEGMTATYYELEGDGVTGYYNAH